MAVHVGGAESPGQVYDLIGWTRTAAFAGASMFNLIWMVLWRFCCSICGRMNAAQPQPGPVSLPDESKFET